MAYAQIHVGAPRHPKVDALSDAAFRLWVIGLCHCQEYLTDGIVALTSVKKLGGRTKTIAELTANRLWVEVPSVGYRVHDYLAWNDSKEVVESRRAKWRLKKEKRELPQGNPPEKKVETPPDLPNALRTVSDRTEILKLDAFDAFWAAYPRKVGKGGARTAWKRLKPSVAMAEIILAAVAAQCRQPQWTRDNGQFIPHPATWLNQGRWDDEIERGDRDRAGFSIVRDEWHCPHAEHCTARRSCELLQELERERAQA